MTAPGPVVCYWRGVIDSVVDKLTDLKKTNPKVCPLLEELERIREDPVKKFEGQGGATHNKQVKVWMKQNRHLVYDIEDWIDLKLAGKLDESESDFEERIQEFEDKIKESRARSKRVIRRLKTEGLYGRLQEAPASDADLLDAAPRVDPRQLMEEKKAVLVGIDGPRKSLVKLLQDTQEKRKVVSVLGPGGLGKTTLAMKVYEELHGQFECHASVTVGRSPSTLALMDVLRQVNPEKFGHFPLYEQEVIPRLWEFLINKRYFVLIDDIRNTHDWSVVNCALPNNDMGCRILTTTRVEDVAMSCSVRPTDIVYKMKGLDEDDSKQLLLNLIPAEIENTSVNFERDDCDDMLKNCGGFPLAIILTAGLLAMKFADLEPLGKSEESGAMRNVLEICFADLAPPVKACFLYLSTFPENYTIKKDRVIKKWVAEGFIPQKDQQSMLETGESYFNELVYRKLIQPVFDDYDDKAVACTVHPVIHDFISSLSREEDFHTKAAEVISGPFPYGTIRRFSVNCSRAESVEADTLISTAVHLSSMRSLMVFGDAGRVLNLSTFNHLRVLDLEDNRTFDDNQLENIGSLFLLRYLGLGGTNVTKLPQQIMELEHLSTLDLRRTSVMELPTVEGSVITSELVSVVADRLILPGDIGEMKQLEELSTVSLLPDDAARIVNKSTQLRVLGVTFGYIYIQTRANQQGVKSFLEEVRKSNLHSLLLADYPNDSVQLLECWGNEGPNNLKKFELRMADCFPVVRPKMQSLIALTHLHIKVRQVEAQGMKALGSLPNLVLLKLFSGEGTQERLTISSEHGFPSLKMFWFSSYFLGMGLQFKAGAMPQLQRLQMEFHASKKKIEEFNFDFGIEHLCQLLQVRAIILCKHVTDSEAKAVEAVIRDQVSQILVHGDGSPRKEETREADSISANVDIRISILPESSSSLPSGGPISFVMEDAMVSYSTGAMNSVLTKLASLMEEEFAKLTSTGEKELMMRLRDELLIMNAHLKQLSDMADLNKEMKECRDQMRELSYDIDDFIEDFMLCSVNKDGSSGTTDKRVVMLRDFTDQIQKLNTQVPQTAHHGSIVRKAEMRFLGPRSVPRKQWLSKVYDQDNRLVVGMDRLRDELVKGLIDDGQGGLQTVCIFGRPGIGKTTLATNVYNEMKSRFYGSWFVSAYQETSLDNYLERIRQKLKYDLSGHLYMEKLIHKRYLIVFDGVPSAQMLKDIEVLLPRYSLGSKIIVTTCKETVAESCGNYFSTPTYSIKPLTFSESLSLFQHIVFGPERSCPSALQKLHEQIVEACHGIPVAITVIAGLLVSKPPEMAHWEAVLEKLVNLAEEDHTIWLRKIFYICYLDLGPEMKTCLLYLSSFLANREIRKDRLIRLWAAEGFLPKRSVEGWFETGECYFFELMARKLIEPVYNDMILVEEDDRVLPNGYEMCDSVFNFIKSLSSEENFVKSGEQQGVFWRINNVRYEEKYKLKDLFKDPKCSKVRSLIYGRRWGSLDCSNFLHLRVLDLYYFRDSKGKDLRWVGRLSLLRYLGLALPGLVSLPQEITTLEHLETVDLSAIGTLKELPAFKSTKLVSLIADGVTLPTNGMVEMQALEELSTVVIHDDAGRLAKVVNQSKRLWRLGVKFDFFDWRLSALYKNGTMDLFGAIAKSNIESLLIIICVGSDYDLSPLDLLVDCWAKQRPRHLQKLELRILCSLQFQLDNIQSPSLTDITHLSISMVRVKSQGLRSIGSLPNLVFLSLEKWVMEERGIISKDGFQCLRVFRCGSLSTQGMGLQFEEGAMPQLRMLQLEFNLKKTESQFGGADFGIQFLTCLVEVHAIIHCNDSTTASVEAAEAAIRDQVSQNRNKPVLKITRDTAVTDIWDILSL